MKIRIISTIILFLFICTFSVMKGIELFVTPNGTTIEHLGSVLNGDISQGTLFNAQSLGGDKLIYKVRYYNQYFYDGSKFEFIITDEIVAEHTDEIEFHDIYLCSGDSCNNINSTYIEDCFPDCDFSNDLIYFRERMKNGDLIFLSEIEPNESIWFAIIDVNFTFNNSFFLVNGEIVKTIHQDNGILQIFEYTNDSDETLRIEYDGSVDSISIFGLTITYNTPNPEVNTQFRWSHISCVDNRVEVHFIINNLPEGVLPQDMTLDGIFPDGFYFDNYRQSGNNTHHYTWYGPDGYYKINTGIVNLSDGSTLKLQNPNVYDGDIRCAPVVTTSTPEIISTPIVSATATSSPTPTSTPVVTTSTPTASSTHTSTSALIPKNTGTNTPTQTLTPSTITTTPESPTKPVSTLPVFQGTPTLTATPNVLSPVTIITPEETIETCTPPSIPIDGGECRVPGNSQLTPEPNIHKPNSSAAWLPYVRSN